MVDWLYRLVDRQAADQRDFEPGTAASPFARWKEGGNMKQPDVAAAPAARLTIRIASPDIPASPLAEQLIASLALDAPSIVPAFYPRRTANKTGRLDRNDTDIALTSIAAPSRLRKQLLATFHYVVVMRRNHPAAGSAMTADE